MDNPRKGWTLLVAGLLGGLLVSGFFIAKPVYDERAAETAKLERLQGESDRLLLSSPEQDALRVALPDEIDRQEIQSAVIDATRGAKAASLDVTVVPIRASAGSGQAAVVRLTAVGTPAQIANLIRRATTTLQLRPGAKYAYATAPSPAMTVEGFDLRALPGGAKVRAQITFAAYRHTVGK